MMYYLRWSKFQIAHLANITAVSVRAIDKRRHLIQLFTVT